MKRTTVIGVDQWSLGDLIEAIKKAGTKNSNDEPKSVSFDFGEHVPAFLCSWRGAYEELSISYRETATEHNLENFLKELEGANGSVFEGYKGGNYKMYLDTPLWVSLPGNASRSSVVGIHDDGYNIVILTAYCEY